MYLHLCLDEHGDSGGGPQWVPDLCWRSRRVPCDERAKPARQVVPLFDTDDPRVRPGQETFLEVSGYVVGSAESTRSLAPEDRGCLFVEEGGLVHYSKYSYASCKFECLTETAGNAVGCVPWYIPHGGDTRVCQPWEALNFTETLAGLSAGDCKRCKDPDLILTNSIFSGTASLTAPPSSTPSHKARHLSDDATQET